MYVLAGYTWPNDDIKLIAYQQAPLSVQTPAEETSVSHINKPNKFLPGPPGVSFCVHLVVAE